MSTTVQQVRLKTFGRSTCSLVFASDFRRGKFRLLSKLLFQVKKSVVFVRIKGELCDYQTGNLSIND